MALWRVERCSSPAAPCRITPCSGGWRAVMRRHCASSSNVTVAACTRSPMATSLTLEKRTKWSPRRSHTSGSAPAASSRRPTRQLQPGWVKSPAAGPVRSCCRGSGRAERSSRSPTSRRKENSVSDWAVQADGPYVVAVDPRLSEDLIQEGLARELVHRVQRLRKEAGYEYTTRIELSVAGAADVVAAVSAFESFVEGETLARRLVLGSVFEEADVTRELDIEARRVTIALRRHDGRKGGTR